MANIYSQLNMPMLNNYSMLGCSNGFSLNGLDSIFGSIFGRGFNSSFYTCDGNYNYDKAAGYAVGQTLLQCFMSAIGSAISSRQANQNAQAQKEESLQKLQTELNGVNASLETAMTNLGIATDNKRNADTKVGECQIALNTATQNFTNTKVTVTISGAQKELTYQELLNAVSSMSPEDKATNAAAIGQAQTKKDAITQAENALEDAKEEQGKAEQALQKAQTEVDTLTTKKTDLETKIRNLSNEVNDSIYNRADGHGYQQSSLSDLDKLFNEGKLVSTIKNTTKNDLRGAIAQYRSATTEEQRKSWASKIAQIWNKLDKDDQNDKNLQAGIKAMSANYPNIKFDKI